MRLFFFFFFIVSSPLWGGLSATDIDPAGSTSFFIAFFSVAFSLTVVIFHAKVILRFFR